MKPGPGTKAREGKREKEDWLNWWADCLAYLFSHYTVVVDNYLGRLSTYIDRHNFPQGAAYRANKQPLCQLRQAAI
jgi:hypothetical protein